jgi:hypothetical protein
MSEAIGLGSELDGWANRDLDIGTFGLASAMTQAIGAESELEGWPNLDLDLAWMPQRSGLPCRSKRRAGSRESCAAVGRRKPGRVRGQAGTGRIAPFERQPQLVFDPEPVEELGERIGAQVQVIGAVHRDDRRRGLLPVLIEDKPDRVAGNDHCLVASSVDVEQPVKNPLLIGQDMEGIAIGSRHRRQRVTEIEVTGSHGRDAALKLWPLGKVAPMRCVDLPDRRPECTPPAAAALGRWYADDLDRHRRVR